ncbi:putative MFS family arabinose efflux permease [Lipingzhangella halophila]|uniref:Putative MFS family arabinose efflux permease n=1 Tax=Lipingzhangella halophila TaxID=1783352 RepID=A0A7W7W2M9_9ACTN|nr:MFS transporter [Lipingzhangella halophila]MBB4930959.1 putative MFS family arabinose efflux permease [Lipingzhangella halophila]
MSTSGTSRTTGRGAAAAPPSQHGSLGGRNFLLLLTATLLVFSNFAPLLTVLPMWAASAETGHGGVGTIAGTMMAATVAVQFLMPWILARFGLRTVLASGALLLGAPALGYLASSDLSWILVVSAVRGVGFGMVVVAASSLTVELVPMGQRGRASGLYGIAVGIPYVLVLPLSVWYVQHAGFGAVFVGTAVLGSLVVPLVAMMSHPRSGTPSTHTDDSGAAASARPAWVLRPLAGPWVVLLWTAVAMGGVTAFLALALPGVAPAALLVLALGIMLGRSGAGMYADRVGYGRLMLPGMASGALGLAGLAGAAAGVGPAGLAIGAAGLYGVSFGVVQNDTFVVMFQRAGPRGTGAASTVWNVGYDAGTGAGSILVGLLAAGLGVAGAFALTSGAILLTAVLMWADSPRRADGASRPAPAVSLSFDQRVRALHRSEKL